MAMIEIKTRPLKGVDELWEVFLWFQENSYENVLREERYYRDAAPPDAPEGDDANRITLRQRWEIIRTMAVIEDWRGRTIDAWHNRRYKAHFSDPSTAAIFRLTWG